MGDLATQIRLLLTAAGLHAVNAFPDYRLPRLVSPMIAVGQGEIRFLPCGFSGYLGCSDGDDVFGAETECVILLDIYSPYTGGGDPCAAAVRSALNAVAGGVSCATLKGIRVDPVYYDEKTDCFRSTLRLTFGSLLFRNES